MSMPPDSRRPETPQRSEPRDPREIAAAERRRHVERVAAANVAPPAEGPPGLHLGLAPLTILVGFVAMSLAMAAVVRRFDLGVLEPYYNPVRAQTVVAWAEKDWQEDVLFLGTSRFDVGLDARLLQQHLDAALPGQGHTVFKLAMTNLRFSHVVPLVQQVLSKRPPKKLLLFDIDPRSFVEERPAQQARMRLRQPFDLEQFQPLDPFTWRPGMRRYDWFLRALQAGADRVCAPFQALKKFWNVYWLVLPETRANVATLIAGRGERRMLDTREDPKGWPRSARDEDDGESGVWGYDLQLQAALAREGGKQAVLQLLPEKDWVWHANHDEQMAAFKQLLDVFDELPCEVVFVRPPAEEGYFGQYMRGPHLKFEAQVLPVIREHGYRYYDLNRAPYPRAEQFFNASHHMSRLGCEAMSRIIVDDLLVPLLTGVEPPPNPVIPVPQGPRTDIGERR